MPISSAMRRSHLSDLMLMDSPEERRGAGSSPAAGVFERRMIRAFDATRKAALLIPERSPKPPMQGKNQQRANSALPRSAFGEPATSLVVADGYHWRLYLAAGLPQLRSRLTCYGPVGLAD